MQQIFDRDDYSFRENRRKKWSAGLTNVGVPEFIIAMEPAMRELLHFREAKRDAALSTDRADEELKDIFQGTPITVNFDQANGGWSYGIALRDHNTGGHGFDSEVKAYRAALLRLSDFYLFGEELETC